jgi:hypothetical protein
MRPRHCVWGERRLFLNFLVFTKEHTQRAERASSVPPTALATHAHIVRDNPRRFWREDEKTLAPSDLSEGPSLPKTRQSNTQTL